MKRLKRVISSLIMACLLLALLPVSALAAHDSTGRPTDLTGQVYLSLYNGTGFPGEPAEHDSADYITFNSDFTVGDGNSVFADSASIVLQNKILEDVVEGTRTSDWLWTNYVWGVYDAEGSEEYLLADSALTTVANEQKLIRQVKGLAANADVSAYEIIWYVIKYQTSDSAWHIDGIVKEKDKFYVNFYGNGSTGGTAPVGSTELMEGDKYTVPGNTGTLQKQIGNNTYVFQGWNTMPDGTGTHYDQNDVITVSKDIALYAEWYLPGTYTATVVTHLDDEPTNIGVIHGEDVSLAISADGVNFIPLSKTQTGTYTVTVTENGTYNIYHSHDGEYRQIENYELTVYNKNARVEIHHYSVAYDTQGGTWQENEDPGFQRYFLGSAVYVAGTIPYRNDATFQHWVDQYGNEYAPNAAITLGIDKPYQLRAVWSDSINIKVNVTINHGTADGYDNNTATMFDAFYQLLMHSGNANLPIGDRVQLTPDSHDGYDFIYDEANRVSTYTMKSGVYAYTDMPQGQYSIHTAKSHYSHTVTVVEEFAANGDLIINIIYNFEPNDFDLSFDIVVDDSVPKELYPQAVNVKILAWYRLNDELGWYPITQQQGDEPPINIPIDPTTGTGSGFYPVWQYWANTNDTQPYFYRVQVTAFVLPDGTIAPTTTTDLINYSIEGGFYNGQVDVVGGEKPEFPAGSNTNLPGVFYNPDNLGQHGVITISTTAKPYSITFNAMGGTINGESILVFENQYRHMDHAHFIPVRDGGYVFEGWYLDEACTIPAHDDHFGELLTSDVVHYAKWKAPRQISGTVYVDGTHGDDTVLANDRVQETIVLLEKLEGGVYNQIGSYPITFTNIMQDVYSGTYIFDNIPLDGSEYRITVIELNYRTIYGNNGDDNFNDTENVAIFVGNAATVDAYLSFEPESYVQDVIVDSSAIAEGFRPSNVEIVILGRDLGDIHPYTTITQHIGGGVVITLTPNGTTYAGGGSESVWIYHTDGALYEYQVSISKVDGSDYQAATAPFYVIYDSPSYYNQDKNGQNAPLKATLVPKSFNVTFDLGLNIGEYVTGMNNYTNGDGTYSTTHTWGMEKKIDATPVRPGYYFKGWKCVTAGVDFFNDTIPATAAEDIVLEAQWERVTGFSYTVHYLDIDTGAVLHPAIITDGMKEGDVVYAANEILGIAGYDFKEPSANSITISSDSALNVIVLYYAVETGASGGGMTNPIDDHLHLKKTAVLNDDGTYTIRLEVYATNNPISTYVRQDTPLDIVLVLDQSGSMKNDNYMDDLQTAADEFISMVASHGRGFEIDHRIAVVGFASGKSDGNSGDSHPVAGGSKTEWVNTGFFDSNGQFHNYGTVGFTYTALGDIVPDTTGTYYVLVAGEAGTSTAVYNNLLYHDEYYHLLSGEDAESRYNDGERVYGYVNGAYLTLTLVGSEWICNGELYSGNDYYSYYRDVWTHRDETDHRHIHAFGTGSNYRVDTEHDHTDDKVYTRTASMNAGDESIYVDALMPVSTGKNGTGPINPGLVAAINNIGGSGATRTQYGIEMANDIFEANPYDSEKETRVRVVVVFTDGQPGYSGFEEDEANAALEQAYVSKNTHGAKVYTIGLYDSDGTDSLDNVSVFMNALSSNYPAAKNMDSVVSTEGYVALEDGTVLDKNKTYYVYTNRSYYALKYGTVRIGGIFGSRKTCWYYSRSSTNYAVTETEAPVVTNGEVGDYSVYQYVSAAYKETPNHGFYQTSGNVEELYVLFDNIVVDITTKTSTEIVLHADGIIRDVMGQGLVLTEGTVITATSVPGMYIGEDNIVWNEGGSHTFATLALRNGWKTDQVTIDIPQKDGSAVSKNIYQIAVYNTHPDNTYTPNGPHTVDVSGYDFSTAFISSEHINGYKLVVEITRVEATDDVVWAHTMSTNNSKSGVWAPADEDGYRELLASFDQPSTIFAHRQYVLDYSKPFTLDGWYYTVGTNAGAVHIDTDVSNGMNWFDPADPTITSGLKTKYGVVKIVDGKVVYTPTTTNWTGYDSFYIFGDTGHAAIVSQDANSNGNLWTKVDIIPANNIYFEDSFVSGYDDTIDAERFGIAFSGNWNVDYAGALPGTNEGSADAVHGWTTDLSDDLMYSDGMAHIASTPGATATFTFTGTGVDIYSRCDIKTGIIVAQLKKQTIGVDGKETFVFAKTMIVDGLAMSGTYYQIPTLTFCGLEYGTYQVMIVVSSATANATGEARFNYYLDGVRVYTPIIDPNTTINDAYGRGEMNAVFTSVRDILLTNQDFNPDMSDSTDGKAGAVFVDWIRDDQGEEGDESGTGKPTYHIGTYAELGPKNEVYLAPGQTVVLKVDPANTYYVGMKCLAGYSVKAGFSGTDGANPVVHTVDHASDLYYKVVPVDGYIVITNTSAADSGEILSLTKLRATNGTGKPVDGGVRYVSATEALEVTVAFMEALYAVPEMPVLPPEETEQDLAHRAVTEAMFENVRIWLSMEA